MLEKTGVRRMVLVVSIIALVGVLFVAGYLLWAFAHGAKIEDGQIIGVPKSHQLTHPLSEYEEPTRDGSPDPLASGNERIYPQEAEDGYAMPPVDENGTVYAPMPEQEFRHVTCTDEPRREVTSLPGNTWSMPAKTGMQAPVITAASTQALPDAPAVLRQADTASVGDESGRVIEGGHVNFPLNSSIPGALSPFGYLHQAHACDSVYQSDASGQVHEYQITSMYTVAQDETKDDALYTDQTGRDQRPELAMVTCAGRYVGDDGTNAPGGTLYYNGFRYNLIVIAHEVS